MDLDKDLIKLFVSYSHEDKDFAQKFTSALSEIGIEYFIDSHIEVGENFVKKIKKEISQSSHFVCLISQATLRSDWIIDEIKWASQNLWYVEHKQISFLFKKKVPVKIWRENERYHQQ